MKARPVHTSFYDSDRVLSLSKDARWLFMYYITNKGIGLTGAYKWGKTKALFETGLTLKEYEKARIELENVKLAFFFEDWVIIPGTEMKTGYDKGVKTSVAYQREMDSLPDEVRSILTESEYPTDSLSEKSDRVSKKTDTPRNHNQKSEIRNQNEGGVGETKTAPAVEEPGVKVLEQFNRVFGKSYENPRSIKSNLDYWLEVYSIAQILEAIAKAPKHTFFKDKLTPQMLLRRRNTRGEDVDYIGDLLNFDKKPVKIVAVPWVQQLKQQENLIINEISEEQRQRNIERLNQMRMNLGRKVAS